MFGIRYSFGDVVREHKYSSFDALNEVISNLVYYSNMSKRPVVILNLYTFEVWQTCGDDGKYLDASILTA